MAFYTGKFYIPSWKVKTSVTDGVAGFLESKIVAGNGITITKESIGGVEDLKISSSSLLVTDVKTSNYSANANEFVVCDISSNGFQVKLPNAPADGTIIIVKIIKVGISNILQLSTQGTDVFTVAGGNTSLYMQLAGETNQVQYKASNGIWYIISTAAPSNFAIGFPGIDATTPIDNTDISIDTTSKVLTVTPPLGYFNIYVDGGGVITRFRKTGNISFPAFTDTSGTWYFYFDATGTAITTQTPWTGEMFSSIVSVYRIVWNATLIGADKLVAQYVDYHQNTIPAETHRWEHAQAGTIWMNGFTKADNALVSGAPNADGRNTVVGIATGTNSDENLSYTVTNSTAGTPWTQDLGNITPASLKATNSALFKIFKQDAGGLLSFLPATRFPFAWNTVSNRPEIIGITGTRTVVTDNRWFVYFIYATPNPVTGDALTVVSATSEFTSLINAQAYNWVDIQNTYSIIGNDNEIRPLYRVIFYNDNSGGGSYSAGCKYSVIREIQDLRKSPVTSLATATGSIPASSVTFVSYDGIASTNTQSALQEIADERLPYAGAISDTDTGYYDITTNLLDTKELDLESYPALQGTAESQVQLPNTGSRFNFGANDFTITFWRYSDIKTASTGNGTYLAVNYPQTYDGSHGYAPIMLGGSGVGNDRLYVTTNGTSTAFVKDIPIKYDEWQYIVITRNGNTWEIWVDNVLEETWTSSITVWSNGTNGTNVLSSWYTNFMNKGFFIKELNFYNVGFSPADVAYYDNSGKGRFGTSADTGLVGGFHFNNSLVDYKGVGNGSWVGNAFYSNSNFVLEGDTTTPTINTVKILDSQFLLNKGINSKYGYFEDLGGTSPYAVKGVSSNSFYVIGQLGYYDGTINYGVHAEIGSTNNIAGRFASNNSGVWVNIVDKYNTDSPFAINAFGKSYFSDGSDTIQLTDGTYAIKSKGWAYFESMSSGNTVQFGLENYSAIVAYKGANGYSALEVGDANGYTYFHDGTYSVNAGGKSIFGTLDPLYPTGIGVSLGYTTNTFDNGVHALFATSDQINATGYFFNNYNNGYRLVELATSYAGFYTQNNETGATVTLSDSAYAVNAVGTSFFQKMGNDGYYTTVCLGISQGSRYHAGSFDSGEAYVASIGNQNTEGNVSGGSAGYFADSLQGNAVELCSYDGSDAYAINSSGRVKLIFTDSGSGVPSLDTSGIVYRDNDTGLVYIK
jgi:hypothetical protein